MNRLPAKDPGKRIGNIFYAPGGPGFAASESVEKMGLPGSQTASEALRDHFDVIGLDQRGCGKSNPVTCDPSLFNTALRKNYMPLTQDDYEKTLDAFEAFGKSCLESTGELLRYMDTISAVKDVEAVRQALGGDVTFWGGSYGTQYAYTYAQLFPKNIRALLLDGMVDHSYSTLQLEVGVAQNDALVLQHFFNWAHENSTSALFGKDVRKIYNQVREKATEKAIPAPGCVQTGACAPDAKEWEIRSNIGNYIKFLRTWPSQAQGLAEALEGNATLLATELATAKSYNGMSLLAVACQDWILPKGTWEVQQNRLHALEALSPYGIGFTSGSLWSIACRRWPVPIRNPQAPINITISAPVLMVHAMWDPAANYDMAVSMQQSIRGSVLLTRQGDGHGSYSLRGDTSAAMDRFLVDLKLPEPGSVYNS
ncbi:MAG: hypothetical protein LQ351_001641 [Letrouitia transgressa]|nr:MAG: hypothetical protein LQ351_001641 [Letrouitia transgressa]